MFGKEDYLKANRKRTVWIAALGIVLIIVATYSICVTQHDIAFKRALEIVWNRLNGVEPVGYMNWLEDYLVCDCLVPRAIGGVAVGAILGVCGAMMQSTIRNPLADPYTTGISSGALLGVTLYTIMGFTIIPVGDSDLGLITTAFVFALIPCAIVILLSAFKTITPSTMILIGIAVMYVFTAISTLMRYTATDEDVATIFAWSVGLLGMLDWDSTFLLIIVFVAVFALGFVYSKTINVLSADDRLCRSLGVNPQTTRVLCLLLVAVATATAVCFVGTIGFVGLVAPHIARIFVGSNNRYLLPASAIIGGLILIAADTYARVATATGLPVGVITSLVGGPLFLIILLRQKKSAWGA
ncbi:MAG: iron ABC transporter permease [Thermoplasmata archaeon]|nr:iron ABC transporter permease [Thermoplasmata archaeon]